MKSLIIWIPVAVMVWFGVSCHDVTVGYLLTEDASYNPDSLVIKSKSSLDEVGEDYIRVKSGQPWVGTSIEGIEGTAPIIVSIKNITSVEGNPEKLREVLSVRGNGVLEIPLQHDVPVGRYVVSLNFKNEGYSRDVDNCFTIIVK